MADDRIRIDKWIWHARLVKTRGLAASLVSGGKVRVNGQKIDKPGRAIGPGDVLTISVAGRVRVLRVTDCGERRGPASEAATLFDDLDPPASAQGVETIDDLGDDPAEQPFVSARIGAVDRLSGTDPLD